VLYPAIEPYDHGLLDVGDVNRVYWELCGNPRGIPVVVLHGGPGSGCSTGLRRYFDPHAYRIVLFERRHHRRHQSLRHMPLDLGGGARDAQISAIGVSFCQPDPDHRRGHGWK
jgi:proline iminopeptidase